jgi:type II secretory pathway pseudopilin PulG
MRHAISQPADDAGYTLIEIVFSIALTSIIIVVIGFSVTQSLTNSASSRNSVDRAAVAAFGARYFAQDVASSVSYATGPPCGSSITPVVSIKTGIAPNTIDVFYFVAGSGPSTLYRRACDGSAQAKDQHLGSTTDALTASALCSDPPIDTTGTCTLTLQWAAPGTPASFTLRGVRRTISG